MHTPTFKEFEGLKYLPIFSLKETGRFGNLSVAMIAHGMPENHNGEVAKTATTTQLALNWKDWKG